MDRYCNRAFYVLSAAKRFDGSGGPRLLVPDLICVNRDGLRTDENGDGHPETNWASDDFRLLPSNADPDSAGNPASRPYTAIEAAGERTRFPAGPGSVRVSGKWGWWRHVRPAGRTGPAVAVAGETAVELADGSDARAGQTILVGAEQMYVGARESNTLTVRRGVNGTARVRPRRRHGGLRFRVPDARGRGRPDPGVDAVAAGRQRVRCGGPGAGRLARRRHGPPRGVDAGAVPQARGGGRRLMEGDVRAARDGLVALLAAVPGLTVVDHPSESAPQIPAALVAYEGRDAVQTLAASLSAGRFWVTLLVASSDGRQAYDDLYKLASASGASGIEAAIAADPTWGGSVDYGHLESVGNVGPRRIGNGSYVGADFHFRYVRRARVD